MSKVKKLTKTNALRRLESCKIGYEGLEYSVEDGLIDGKSVCDKLGISPKVTYKTLIAQRVPGNKEYYVFVLPIDSELDLKKAAILSESKKVELIPVHLMQSVTGYVRGGCSPIGMTKKLPTYLEKSANALEYIYVSGGKKGLTIKLSLEDFIDITDAILGDMVKN